MELKFNNQKVDASFELVIHMRDRLGNILPNKKRHFASDSAYDISTYWNRFNTRLKKKKPKKETNGEVIKDEI